MKKLLLSIICCICGITFAVAQSDEQYHRLTNLPHIYINTFTGAAITSKTQYVYATMRYVDEQDSITTYDSLQIRGRGNSTWNMAKKPYKLKFHEKVKLLGKGYAKTKKWTLLANHGDKTMLRNAITSAMGERAGLKFNPAAKFVDLTLNNRYVGTYQLSDQVDVRPHRVDITEQDYPLTATSDISGGYLLEADGFFDFHTNNYWDEESGRVLAPDGFYTTQKRTPVRIHYPDAEEINRTQTQYISQFINDFENRLLSSDFQQPTSYRELVDSVSLANWYICTEWSGNIDGFFSTYFYKDQADQRIFWGPLWDYDIAYGNDDRLGDTSRKLMKDVGYGTAGNGSQPWVQRMWQDPWFAKMIYRRYKELADDGMEQYLNNVLDSLVQLIDQSQQLNYQRWNINARTLRERVLYSSYDQYVVDLRDYISTHTTYLRIAFAELAGEDPDIPLEPVEPGFLPEDDTYYALSNAGSNTFIDVNMQTMDICCNARNEQSQSQQWMMQVLGDGSLHITNRATGMALADPTPGRPTATTLVGDTLCVVKADTASARQRWEVVAQARNRYNLVNRYTHHAANLLGGNRADGTPVLSYTSDDRNMASNNRLWYITEAGHVDSGIDQMEGGIEYALAYDPVEGRLHFGTDDMSQLNFTVRVFDQSGRQVMTFRASDGAKTNAMSRGLYLITWREAGRIRTAKLLLGN